MNIIGILLISLIYTKNYSIWDPGGNPALSSDVGGPGDSGASGTTQTCIDRSCEFRHSSNHQNGTEKKYTHTHITMTLNTHVYGLSRNYFHQRRYYWTHIKIAHIFDHLRLPGHLAINLKCTSFECNTT